MAGPHVNKGDVYTCEGCGKRERAVQSHEESLAEAEIIFGEVPAERLAVVCEECYKKCLRRLGFHLGRE
jgi:hypothetical protein